MLRIFHDSFLLLPGFLMIELKPFCSSATKWSSSFLKGHNAKETIEGSWRSKQKLATPPKVIKYFPRQETKKSGETSAWHVAPYRPENLYFYERGWIFYPLVHFNLPGNTPRKG